jgi:hypothetical protein
MSRRKFAVAQATPDRIGALAPVFGRAFADVALAGADGIGAFLSTGTARNVTIYARSGFRVVEEADAPDGGPRIYFMRWDPQGSGDWPVTTAPG